MISITRDQFHETSKDCLKILVEEHLLQEKLYTSIAFQRRFDELMKYCAIQVDIITSKPTSVPVIPSQRSVDIATLRWALKLKDTFGSNLHFNETLNMLRSYIVDILIDEYGESYKPLRLFGQRWGCYRLWAELAQACGANYVQETRNYWRDQVPDYFEDDEKLTTQPS